ncbi:MAG: hypothetical protein D6722_14855 [Bacteroidetes bacterium]|nr:MAG: hypothetical protein D6722_14855 [Bacteroidota bacterium]
MVGQLHGGEPVTDPSVSTQAVSGVSFLAATGNGNITSLGSLNPTAYGVCWSTASTPTLADSYTDEGAANSTGAFTSAITGLTPNTTYYVRAYASNPGGTAYGSQVSFKIPALTFTPHGGYALEFDGVDDYVEIADAGLNFSGTSMTLEAWIYPTAWAPNIYDGCVIVKEDLSHNGYMLRVGNSGQVQFTLGNGSNWSDATSDVGTLTLNKWQHLAGVVNAGNMTLYVDGRSVATGTLTGSFAGGSDPLRLGGDYTFQAGRIGAGCSCAYADVKATPLRFPSPENRGLSPTPPGRAGSSAADVLPTDQSKPHECCDTAPWQR